MFDYHSLFSIRHGLHENWYTITIFILHLAVCDLLYCGINLPFYVHVYMGYEWTFGEGWCVASIILAFLFSNADWMALALIAFNRALSVFHPKFLQDHCTKAKSMMAIIFSWILVLLILSPAFFEVCFISTVIRLTTTTSFLATFLMILYSTYPIWFVNLRNLQNSDITALGENVICLKLECQVTYTGLVAR